MKTSRYSRFKLRLVIVGLALGYSLCSRTYKGVTYDGEQIKSHEFERGEMHEYSSDGKFCERFICFID